MFTNILNSKGMFFFRPNQLVCRAEALLSDKTHHAREVLNDVCYFHAIYPPLRQDCLEEGFDYLKSTERNKLD